LPLLTYFTNRLTRVAQLFPANTQGIVNKLDKNQIEPNFILLLGTSKGLESRKRILNLLLSDAKGCNEIAIQLELNWRTVYRHLKLLEKGELVKVADFGQRKFYQITLKGENTIKQANKKNTN